MATSKKPHPSMGGSPNAKGGSRPLDHPSTGTMPGSVDNTRLGMTGVTAPSCGKAHQSSGGGERKRSFNPDPVSYNTVGGLRTKVGK
jgi:hypothetical protein